MRQSKNHNAINQKQYILNLLFCFPGPDLLTTMTKLYDAKLKEETTPPGCILTGEGLPFVDDSPEKHPQKSSPRPTRGDLYRNPSLHKNHFKPKLTDDKPKTIKKENAEPEKDEDSSVDVPDNERHLIINPRAVKLTRSESLNKPERTASPLNIKLKRSESLNKTGDKLKRSDSLTKTEKTESNISKRRELKQRSKRKNGMPDRSIKRRHTVGGTKDPDKVNWLDNKYQEEMNCGNENGKRTSSPDLSSTRRDRLFLEINLTGPEDIVVALREHLMGGRPQSFPESAVFKVPLESHV